MQTFSAKIHKANYFAKQLPLVCNPQQPHVFVSPTTGRVSVTVFVCGLLHMCHIDLVNPRWFCRHLDSVTAWLVLQTGVDNLLLTENNLAVAPEIDLATERDILQFVSLCRFCTDY